MSKDDLLTVQQFAKLAQKTPQTIYKQLNNRLNPFVKLVDDQKMIEYRALIEIYNIKVDKPIQPEFNNPFNQKSNAEIEFLKKETDRLHEQLKAKDEQIAALTKQLGDTHRLLDQQQQLQLGVQKQLEEKNKRWTLRLPWVKKG